MNPSATPTNKETQVSNQMGNLLCAIESTESAVSSLGDRLTNVLRKEPANITAKEPGAVRAVLVPLAEDIAAATRRIDAIRDELNRIRGSVEL